MNVIARLAVAGAALACAPALPAQTLTPPGGSDTASTAGCRWSGECSAPGTALRMEEVSRTGTDRKASVVVSPRATGFAPGEPLTFWMRRLGGGSQWLATGIALDSAGRAGCADRARHAALAAQAGDGWCPLPLDSLRLTVGGAMRGEPFDFALATTDGRIAAYSTVYPRPIASEAAGCGRLWASLVDARGTAVRIHGSGLAPSTRFTTESRSGAEVSTGEITTDAHGNLPPVIVLPGVKGKRGGEATWTAKAAACTLTLAYPWGRDVQ